MKKAKLFILSISLLVTVTALFAMQQENSTSTELERVINNESVFIHGNKDNETAILVKQLLENGAQPTNWALFNAILDEKNVTARLLLKKMHEDGKVANFLNSKLVLESPIKNQIYEFVFDNQ